MEEGEYGFAGWLVIIIINGSHRGRDESLFGQTRRQSQRRRKEHGHSHTTDIDPIYFCSPDINGCYRRVELCPELCQAGIITGTLRFIDEQAEAQLAKPNQQDRTEHTRADRAAENLE